MLVLAVVSRYALETELDFMSLYAPVWVFSAYLGMRHGRRTSRARSSTLFWVLAIVAVTAAVLAIHAV